VSLHKGQTNSGSFKKGHVSWLRGVKGVHNSPSTEFKKGRKDKKHSKFMKKLWKDQNFKSSINRKKTKKHREKLRKANLGKKLSEQTKKKIGESNRGKHSKKFNKNSIVKHHIYLKENSNKVLKLNRSQHIKLHFKVYNYLYELYGKNGIDDYIKWFKKNYLNRKN
jgi:hypothetical protein